MKTDTSLTSGVLTFSPQIHLYNDAHSDATDIVATATIIISNVLGFRLMVIF